MNKYLFLLTFIFFIPSVCASEIGYCPSPNELTIQDNHWVAANNWRSDQSISGNKIVSFLGAQWIGVNLGSIVCLYKEIGAFSFPVALKKTVNFVVDEPKNISWAKTSSGWKQCISSDISTCSFTYESNSKSTTEIYQQIQYKDKNPNYYDN